ncbi:proton-coupled folate transporter-like [Vanessa cardui]|uniref:proton-coupled folate transporter-like n=1 Tax=Vanessa cardui TaxID=171605 RepID=UPI001F144A13|nr:proton-coupled folate transporter-like [Vanessa cardui]
MATKVTSETELADTKVNNGKVENNREVEQEVVQRSFSEKIKNFINFFTVEPFLFCYILPNIISSIAVQKLNMEKACRVDLNYSEYICSQAISGDFSDNITEIALGEAQTLVADMTSWKQPLQSGIPALLILFVGAWSDKTGNRKYLMLIPMFGELVSAVGLILTTYFFLEWPLWITGLIEALPSAFSGGLSIALMGSYSYIADVTTVETRTFRMGCVAVIVTLGIPLGSSISGVLLELVGFYGIFGIGALLYTFGFLHTYFRIHDVNRVKIEGTFRQKLYDFFNPKNAWDTLSLLFLTPKKELIQIWLVVWAHIVVIGPVFGESAVLFLYTLKKFNMGVVEFSLFSTYSVLMGLAGTAVAVTVLSKYFKVHDDLLGAIATTSKVLSSFVYGLAPNKSWFYAGPVLDFFGNCGSTVVRSLGTKVVDPDEIGKICSLIGVVEAIVPVIYTPIYSKLYSKTLETLPGAFYLLGGLMTIPAVFIFIFLYFIHKRQEKDVVKDPDAKVMHAHDNAVTVL